MSDELGELFRCVEEEAAGGGVFEAGVGAGEGPHTPYVVWQPFRRWKTRPDEGRLVKARAAALEMTRFFRMCQRCHELTNAGCMHDRVTCHGCAERYLGVIH